MVMIEDHCTWIAHHLRVTVLAPILEFLNKLAIIAVWITSGPFAEMLSNRV